MEELLDFLRDRTGTDDVELEDYFLDVGGHSIIAVEFAELLRERFNFELDLETLFKGPLSGALAGIEI